MKYLLNKGLRGIHTTANAGLLSGPLQENQYSFESGGNFAQQVLVEAHGTRMKCSMARYNRCQHFPSPAPPMCAASLCSAQLQPLRTCRKARQRPLRLASLGLQKVTQADAARCRNGAVQRSLKDVCWFILSRVQRD